MQGGDFQFPLLGSQRFEARFKWTQNFLSIPFVGFPLRKHASMWLLSKYLSIPFVGFDGQSCCQAMSHWKLSIPFVGFITTQPFSQFWIQLYFQFPLLGSAVLKAIKKYPNDVFQFPLLGSKCLMHMKKYLRNLTFNSLCWVHEAIALVMRQRIPFQFPLLGSLMSHIKVRC